MLPEHVLGTLERTRRRGRPPAPARVRRMPDRDGRRWPRAWRRSRERRTTEPPPDELEDRVRAVLERGVARRRCGAPRRRTARWLGRGGRRGRGRRLCSHGASSRRDARRSLRRTRRATTQLLHDPRGRRSSGSAALTRAWHHPLEGSVVVYDSHVDQSWGVVFVRTSGVSGEATATLSSTGGADGRTTIDAGPSRSTATATAPAGS